MDGKIVYPSVCIFSVILCFISQDDTSIPCSHLVWSSNLDFSACFISLSIPINWNDRTPRLTKKETLKNFKEVYIRILKKFIYKLLSCTVYLRSVQFVIFCPKESKTCISPSFAFTTAKYQ